jgi:hypothetical protein
MWVCGLPLPSPKAPAIESKWLFIAVAHLILFSLLVAILTYNKCYKIIADIFGSFCNCGWPVPGCRYIEWCLPWEKQYHKAGVRPTDYMDGPGDDSRISGEIFDHHRSLLQCCSSRMVQDDDGDLRTSGEIYS